MQSGDMTLPLYDPIVREGAEGVFGDSERPMARSLSRLRQVYVPTLALLPHVPWTSQRDIFFLAGSVALDSLSSLVLLSPRELERRLSNGGRPAEHVLSIIAALVHVNAEIEDELQTHTLKIGNYSKPKNLKLSPSGGANVGPQLARVSKKARVECWDLSLLYAFKAREMACLPGSLFNEKMRYAFPLCAQLHDTRVGSLRHYYAVYDDADRELMQALSGRSITQMIGTLVDNTGGWVMREFAAGSESIIRLLHALRVLEQSIVLLHVLEQELARR